MKKLYSLFLVMLICSSMVFSQVNIALNKPVTTSTVANATYPKLLNDGNNATAWNSSTNATQWVQIDLTDVYDLTNITISWGAASAGVYSISTSQNAKDWTILSQITSLGAANTKSLDVTKSSVRYLRINMNIPNSANGYAINEVTVSGTPSTVTVVPTISILPKNEFIVSGYTSPRLLSINNSLIDRNDQPTIFNPLTVSAGKNAFWEKQTRLGMDLRFHYEEGDGLLADGTPTAKYKVRSQAWTHIILQEQSNKPLTDYADFLASVKLWVAYIRANCPNPNARIILDMNWPYTDAVDFKGDMVRLWTNYMMVAAETGVSVYPVGKAYDIIFDKDGASTKNALYTDNRHPSLMASYMSSCVILADLYEINPEGIAYFPAGMTTDQAQLMQTRANETAKTIQNTSDINGKIYFTASLTDQFNRTITNDDPTIWSVSGGGTIDSNGTFTSNNSPGIYTATVTKGSVSAFTTFEVKSFAVNPQLSTGAATNVTPTTATANGTITLLGNPAPTQYGHCWNNVSGPTILNNKTTNGPASLTGAFTSALSGLTPNTTYYVKAYATNANGTFYGPEVVFTTPANTTLQLTTLLVQTIPGTYTWTCPEGVTSVQIECWGAGGAGGGSKNLGLGSSSVNANCGGGGAGGSYVKHTSISVTPGTVYNYTVGAGGTGVVAAKGNDGGNTTFDNTTLVAFGGGGGAVSALNELNTAVIASTAGGVCQTPTTGTTNYAGGNGGNSKNSTGYYSGGGGGAADSGGAGRAASATTITGGAAGMTGGGAGGNGITGTGAMGNAGSAVGGGGAGSSTGQGDTNRAGGNGAAGKIIISTFVTTGISAQAVGSSISIYPNPATNQVQLSEESVEIALYSLQGQLVLSNRNTRLINVSTIASGMYILRFTGKGGNKQSIKLEIRH
jgi:hypothetical protein